MVVVAIACLVSSCQKAPHILGASAKFLSHPVEIIDGSDTARVSGQLLLEVESDVDLEATALSSHVWATVSGCTSGTRTLGGITSLDGSKATLLVPYMDLREPTYDLSRSPEPICIVIGIGSMNPFRSAQSQAYRLKLDDGVLSAMRQFAEAGGKVTYSRVP